MTVYVIERDSLDYAQGPDVCGTFNSAIQIVQKEIQDVYQSISEDLRDVFDIDMEFRSGSGKARIDSTSCEEYWNWRISPANLEV